MNELLSLYSVLFLVYLLQGVATATQRAVVFFSGPNGSGRLLPRGWQLSRSVRVFLLNPFSPLSRALYVEASPFSFKAEPSGDIQGVNQTDHAAEAINIAITFDTNHHFTARLNHVLLGDQRIATLHSERSASRTAALLTRLQSAPASKRSLELKRELRRSFQIGAVRKRLELFSESTVLINALCLSLFLFIFIAAPFNIYFFGLPRVWLILLIMLCAFPAAILWSFRRTHRILYSQIACVDMKHVLTIALSPFAAIRAGDLLAADLLADFHPIAVACALLPRDLFLTFAEKELRRIKFIVRDELLEEQATIFLESQQADPRSLLKPPVPSDERCQTYCPACLAQYVVHEGTCRDCDEVLLLPLKAVEP